MYFLLTAPHPDDDVIGLGDYIQHLNGHRVGVWFMTDGGNFARREEATKALNLLGVQDIFWRTLPFYQSIRRTLTHQDIDQCASFLSGIPCDTIGICYDADPHKTHVTCYTILQHALKQIPTTTISSVVLYKSAWGNTTSYPPTCKWLRWNVRDGTKKRLALECHQSQLSMGVHDGCGTNLLTRGHLKEEEYCPIPLLSFYTLPPCQFNWKRRTIYTTSIAEYVWTNVLAPLTHPHRIIFPTGQTPLALYKLLRQHASTIPAHQVYQLDEYVHSTEYQDYLVRELPDHFHLHAFAAKEKDSLKACVEHDARCQQVDICILGIGQNGHIGFNEPPGHIDDTTRLVDLQEDTVANNKTSHRQALTLGIRTLLTAKTIIVMAKQNKHAILERLYQGESGLPVACLEHHPNVTLVVEE